MQTLKSQMTEVQDRTVKKSKKEIYEISRHYKLLETEMLDGIKLLQKRKVLQLNIILFVAVNQISPLLIQNLLSQ